MFLDSRTGGARVKVLAVSTWYPSTKKPTSGVFVQRDCRALAKDHDVTVVHLAPAKAGVSNPVWEQDGRLRVLRLPFDPHRPVAMLGSWRRLRSMLPGADLVHSMAFSSIIPLAVGRHRNPWVHTEHWSGISAPWSLSPGLRRVMPLLSRILALPDVVAAVCEYLAVPVRRRRSGPTVVVPCVIEQQTPPTPRPETDGVLRLVAVGGLVPGKDPLTAVRTVVELRRRGIACHLTWVGGGPLEADVHALVGECGVSDAVDLVGTVPADEVATRLSAADLLFLPSRHENFCVSAAEALLAGRPVVIGSHGGQAEYIDETVGQLVDTQTPEAYADAVVAVHKRFSGVPAEHFSRRVSERFSEVRVRAGYRDVYAMAVAARRKRAT
jgi:glycosyltransferase involved in cell wall biosynthesis